MTQLTFLNRENVLINNAITPSVHTTAHQIRMKSKFLLYPMDRDLSRSIFVLSQRFLAQAQHQDFRDTLTKTYLLRYASGIDISHEQ